MKKIIIVILFWPVTNYFVFAQTKALTGNARSQISDYQIQVAPGRLTLIDLGAPLKSKPWLANNKLARVYTLFNKKNNSSILVVQGISDSGACDLTADTESGIVNVLITAKSSPGNDLIMDPNRSSIIDNKNFFQLNSYRTALIKLKSKIDEFVLAGDPDLIKCKAIFDFYDPNFLKSFALSGSNTVGKTDIVIATELGIIKFELEVNTNENQHNNIIDFSTY
ncbi:MAG: hypothetical protein RLZZ361_598 [Cyanobacteriota bacterium]|jgi:hypothetical protein